MVKKKGKIWCILSTIVYDNEHGFLLICSTLWTFSLTYLWKMHQIHEYIKKPVKFKQIKQNRSLKLKRYYIFYEVVGHVTINWLHVLLSNLHLQLVWPYITILQIKATYIITPYLPPVPPFFPLPIDTPHHPRHSLRLLSIIPRLVLIMLLRLLTCFVFFCFLGLWWWPQDSSSATRNSLKTRTRSASNVTSSNSFSRAKLGLEKREGERAQADEN